MSYKVWTNAGDPFDPLVAVGTDRIVMAKPDKASLDVVAVAIASGDIPEEAKQVPLSQVLSVRINETDHNVVLKYGDKKQFNFTSTGLDQSLDIFATLRGLLPSSFIEDRKEYSPISALRAPVIAAVVIAFLTWLLAAAAADVGDEADTGVRRAFLRRVIAGILDLLGPTGVVIIGLLALGVCAKVALGRWKNPPIYRTLEPK